MGNEPVFQFQGIAPTIYLLVESGLVVQLGLTVNAVEVCAITVLFCPFPVPSYI